MSTEVTRLNAEQFMTGLLLALAERGYSTLSVRGTRFDAAVQETYRRLRMVSEKHGVAVRFRIATDPIHGDSMVVRQALSVMAQRGLIGLDNPEFLTMRFRVRPDQAREILKGLPGGEALFGALAHELLAAYNSTPVLEQTENAEVGVIAAS